MTLQELANQWLAESTAKLAKSMKEDRIKRMQVFLTFMEKKEIPNDPDKWLDAMVAALLEFQKWMLVNSTPWVTERTQGFINRMFKYGQELGVIQRNPVKMLPKVKVEVKRRDTLTEEEYWRTQNWHRLDRLRNLHKRMPRIIQSIFIVAWHTGLTLKDICLLKWGSVDWDNLIITKERAKTAYRGTGSIRQIVPMVRGGELHKLLSSNAGPVNPKQKDPNDYVFPRTAEWYCRDKGGLTWTVNNWIKRCGIKGKTLYSFRHAFISRVVNSGANLVVAAQISGHKQIQTLQRYVHPDKQALTDVIYRAFKPEDPTKPPTNVVNVNDTVWLDEPTDEMDQPVDGTGPAQTDP